MGVHDLNFRLNICDAYGFRRPGVMHDRGQDAGVSDQQHDLAAPDDRRPLQEPLAGRVVLQMDQAAFAHQAFSGHQRERSENANLVRGVHLCADRHYQKGASPRCLALHFATDIVSLGIRENPAFMRLAARYHQNHFATHYQPIDVVRFLTGHY